MSARDNQYNRSAVLHALMHYLPSQAPLKDFIHHNTLHAFQDHSFFDGLKLANGTFGYRTTCTIKEYRDWYRSTPEANRALKKAIELLGLSEHEGLWTEKALSGEFPEASAPRLGRLRSLWKESAGIDLDALVHPFLFRILGSYLDQGLAQWEFPGVREGSFLDAIRALDRWTVGGLFRQKSTQRLLHNVQTDLEDLLHRVVGSEQLYVHYLFDQQFAHPGWSGMVAQIESNPSGLYDQRKIRLEELIFFELLLEHDFLESKLGKEYTPVRQYVQGPPPVLFEDPTDTEKDQVVRIWQTAYEWATYDGVLRGIQLESAKTSAAQKPVFQALFCIDDREESYRRYLEFQQPQCLTYGTPGFFGLDARYLPAEGKFPSKICPAPVETNRIVREVGKRRKERDLHFSKSSHSFHGGFLLAQSLGFFSFVRLFSQLIRPVESSKTSSSNQHMPEDTQLLHDYATVEIADRLELLLRSIGLMENFAPLIYIVGHGASSTNNPHYAAYDCGACSGRAGSVNARLVAEWGNNEGVRAELDKRGILIPQETRFVGGLHDTTRDTVTFYDEESLPELLKLEHAKNKLTFSLAAGHNAKERSRRFESIRQDAKMDEAHRKVGLRSVSLFEPRPELNHATNAFCVVGERRLTRNLFLDRRAFLNSYDPKWDAEGTSLLSILKAAAPVCGGINLEYYFSRVDNLRLGAGSKLPHNVVGLIGVSNGIDGDLRPGLPSQMIEVHDPVRLMMVLQQDRNLVEQQLKSHPPTFRWFELEWIHLVVIDPTDHKLWRWNATHWEEYIPFTKTIPQTKDWLTAAQGTRSNISVKHLERTNHG